MFFRRFVFLLLFSSPLALISQAVDISVRILQSFSEQAILYQYANGKKQPIDTARLSEGYYTFHLESSHKKGLYSVGVGKGININFVVNNEPFVDIYSVVYAPEDSLKSQQSVENMLFWQFQSQKKLNNQQLWLLNSLLDFYPDTSNFKQNLKNEISSQAVALHRLANDLTFNHPQLLASQLILLEQTPLVNFSNGNFEELAHVWWGHINLKTESVTNSPAFYSRIWAYLEMFFCDDFDKEEQDNAFIVAIDNLFKQPMDMDLMANIRNVLLENFISSSYTAVADYLETQRFGTLEPLKVPSDFHMFSEDYSTKVGQKAYDFMVTNSLGEQALLSSLNAKSILVLFWSAWCPHCIEEIPEIVELYNRYKGCGFEVVAVSIDSDEDEALWQSYVKKLDMQWINVRESILDNSEVLTRYRVEETPLMFLLSEDLTIISKPATRRQLRARLRKLY